MSAITCMYNVHMWRTCVGKMRWCNMEYGYSWLKVTFNVHLTNYINHQRFPCPVRDQQQPLTASLCSTYVACALRMPKLDVL